MQPWVVKLLRVASAWLLYALSACSQERPARESVPAEENPVVDCTGAADAALPNPDALCAVLCQVPGGVDECPVGTPCPRDAPAPADVDQQNAVQQSLCERADPVCVQARRAR